MELKEIFEEYMSNKGFDEAFVAKFNYSSYYTPNFAYIAERIGNSIGDIKELAISMTLLEEIASEFKLVFYTAEHIQLHTKGKTQKDLETLVKAALVYEKIKANKEFKNTITDFYKNLKSDLRQIIKNNIERS